MSVRKCQYNRLLRHMFQKTSFFMGIDNSHCLQVGIDNRSAYKFHPSFFQICGDRVRQFGTGFPCFINGLPIGPFPEIAGKTLAFLLDGPEDTRIVYCRFNFPAVAYDARILAERIYLFFSVSADFFRLEIIECRPEMFPFIENALPGQSGLDRKSVV